MHHSPLNIWWLAIRPKTLGAAVAPVLIGIAIAWRDDKFDTLAALAALLGALFPFGVRWLEPHLTHHPAGYDGNKEWQLPENAEEVWFTAADGMKLNGWFLHASKQSSTRRRSLEFRRGRVVAISVCLPR